tara:strand:+ start:95 stop:1228 length:1134 start_codon:yes stop_codon:yes gene_type:complete
MRFTINKTDDISSARAGTLETEHGDIETPVFMPIGTVGAVKTFSPHELEGIGARIILGNTYHLYLRPGMDVIQQAGGLQKFINWSRPILTDSGGFQVFSLAKLNKITDDGVEFRSHLDGSAHTMTPEISMGIQRKLGSDIIMAFDECPPGNADKKIIRSAVVRTSKWMKRCKIFLDENPPLYNSEQTLFPIIQGATDEDLRRISAEQLIPYSSCGMAIGGLAVGEEKNAMLDTIEQCDNLLPKEEPRYLMGIGRPSDLVNAVGRGMDMFDCVIPTRNGRNGQIFSGLGVININNERYKKDFSPIDENSSHAFGRIFSKAYVRHLFNINEILGLRIASTLNLAYYIGLMATMRQKIHSGDFSAWSREWFRNMEGKKGM